MWRGLYTAASGMVTEMYRTDNIANNLSNANTTGFKRAQVAVKEFAPMLLHRINDKDAKTIDVTKIKQFSVNPEIGPVVGILGRGSDVAEIATDYTQGSLMSTGNPLDLAISGEGYFSIQARNGDITYTRDGNFYRSNDGALVNVNGEAVLDTRGRSITIPAEYTTVVVGPEGRISGSIDGVNNAEIAQIQFVAFDNPREQLEKIGNNQQYRARADINPVPATGSIQQGMLERANTNVVDEMVEMIASYRAYEANSKAVVTQDSLLDKAVNEVGRGT